jgi:hypothetical protein
VLVVISLMEAMPLLGESSRAARLRFYLSDLSFDLVGEGDRSVQGARARVGRSDGAVTWIYDEFRV